MSDDATNGKAEIVIVRRRGADDGAAGKGGAWKIAYADFVTAMMAFFLVMWLINASNEETRAQVASYFNPIKLTDNSTGARGLKDKKEHSSETTAAETGGEGTVPPASETKKHAELMADPAKVIAKLEEAAAAKAGDATTAVAASSKPQAAAPGVGDPFDPRPWEKGTAPSEAEKKSKPELAIPPDASKDEIPAAELPPPEKDSKEEPVSDLPKDPVPPDVPPKEPPPEAAAPGLNEGDKEAAEITAEIARRLGTGLDSLPASIDVRLTDEGVLISLTDKESFGMFKSGSAEPQPELVRLVETIAGVLADRKGYLVIRGHTDSRPYRRKTYDNWQLSTARAHLAQYMLVRGGVDEKRIRRIEGMADRQPRNPSDPQAPENRRIEILLGLER